jgi:hypothetical protein
MRKALLIIAIVVLALVPIAAYALVVNTPARADVRFDYSGSATSATIHLRETDAYCLDLRS